MVYNTGNADTTGTGDGSKIRGGEDSERECYLGEIRDYKLTHDCIYNSLFVNQDLVISV